MNKSQLSWYVGQIVHDFDYGMDGLVISHSPKWIDQDGQSHAWDFEILYEDGEVGHADLSELEVVSNAETQEG